MPRPYQLGKRQAAADETRARVLDAARTLLTRPEGLSSFSIDAVARQADVARMTVYYQFGSKAGLLEAIFDDLANRGGMDHMGDAFRQPEPLDALEAYIGIFGHFYGTHRLIIRRVRGLAVLDPDLEQSLRARDERRRMGLGVIVRRIGERYGKPDAASLDETVSMLHMLTSFESFDTLAGTTRTPEDVTPNVRRLARAALDLSGHAQAQALESRPPSDPNGDAPSCGRDKAP